MFRHSGPNHQGDSSDRQTNGKLFRGSDRLTKFTRYKLGLNEQWNMEKQWICVMGLKQMERKESTILINREFTGVKPIEIKQSP